jgi:hypothetical protein
LACLAAWQHPFTSIFKLCDVEGWKHVCKEGNVVAVLVRPAFLLAQLQSFATKSPGSRTPALQYHAAPDQQICHFCLAPRASYAFR